jgi:GNAT superfamily N-acetyltransferase
MTADTGGGGAVSLALASFTDEPARLRPRAGGVLDAHAHLGADEDGQSLDLATLIAHLDQIAPGAKACAFPFHDPDRQPGYRRPNDRVLAWAGDSGGRVIPYCRLDPAEDPVGEAKRCLARGARGIKLHPRAQSFGFGDAIADAIFAIARDGGVPILVHAGRGMPPMDALADLAWRHPDVPLVLAHAAIAGQGLFASRLKDHPAALYDTSCFSPWDVVELFARVPAERIVFASDVPYGRPAGGLYMALRVARLAGLDDEERAIVVGGTMAAVIDGSPLTAVRPPRLDAVRPINGRLLRVGSYLLMAFASMFSAAAGGLDPARALPGIALARCVCRDPEPGGAGPALTRIDAALSAAEELIAAGAPRSLLAIGLVHAASTIAATEPP